MDRRQESSTNDNNCFVYRLFEPDNKKILDNRRSVKTACGNFSNFQKLYAEKKSNATCRVIVRMVIYGGGVDND